MRIDLHTHSRVSDGTDAPALLVRKAAAVGLDVVALTDHDTAAGWSEATEAARDAGVTLVPGMEISTVDGHRSVHLLAYLLDPTYPPLAEELARILAGRSARVPVMVDRLRRLGVDISVDDVVVESSDAAASGRPHVADALVRLGVVRDREEAFDRYLGAGRPAFIERYAADLHTMIRHVKAAGGVTVIAHPWGRSRREQPDEAGFAVLKAAGLSGIEVDHQDHTPEQRARLRAIARELDLVATGSSDYHGTGKTQHDLGVNSTSPEDYRELMERAVDAAAASGRDVPQVSR